MSLYTTITMCPSDAEYYAKYEQAVKHVMEQVDVQSSQGLSTWDGKVSYNELLAGSCTLSSLLLIRLTAGWIRIQLPR